MINIVIPVFNPDNKLYILIEKLRKQTIDNYIIIVDSGNISLEFERINRYKNINVVFIQNTDFNHGKTRNLAANNTKTDFFIFMTQDAVPNDDRLVEELLAPFSDLAVAAVYGKQIANKNAKNLECFSRMFNYPDENFVKVKNDIDKIGIKAFFLSDVCAAYRARDFFEFGGFPDRTICNEDMILASKFILGNKKIVYNSKAVVYHSHNYNYFQQFRRNFDIGVSLKENKEILKYAKSEKEGIKYIKSAVAYCFKIKKPYLIIDLFFESIFKFLGYKLGLNYEKIPYKLRKIFSLNRGYWK